MQVCTTLPAAAAAEQRRLVAYRKLTLAPGAGQRITCTIPADDLTVWNSGCRSLRETVPAAHSYARYVGCGRTHDADLLRKTVRAAAERPGPRRRPVGRRRSTDPRSAGGT
ncbi:fibronectin type III-like domain-contianing protein [Streptomyces sp. NPDC006482]|uniref:fibronectin type III-like domain-contianing protein n=1 Tax=Streptomyces sp. NPDC006482 TaxID=3154306 RepID=UPI0033B62B01